MASVDSIHNRQGFEDNFQMALDSEAFAEQAIKMERFNEDAINALAKKHIRIAKELIEKLKTNVNNDADFKAYMSEAFVQPQTILEQSLYNLKEYAHSDYWGDLYGYISPHPALIDALVSYQCASPCDPFDIVVKKVVLEKHPEIWRTNVDRFLLMVQNSSLSESVGYKGFADCLLQSRLLFAPSWDRIKPLLGEKYPESQQQQNDLGIYLKLAIEAHRDAERARLQSQSSAESRMAAF